jgi:periplasmic protein TonB
MERPSHIIFDRQSHYFSQRLPWMGLALSLQFAVLWLFMHGLASYPIGEIIHDIEIIPVRQDETVNPVKPPEPVLKRPEKIQAEQPIFTTQSSSGERAIDVEEGQKQAILVTPPLVPDRGAVAITATHTVPPYPPIARRIGAEGKVTLRLTVSAEGRVSHAEIVTSSGRDDLDQTAQQWIVTHWVYKPALANGVGAVSHVLATVAFSLTNER